MTNQQLKQENIVMTQPTPPKKITKTLQEDLFEPASSLEKIRKQLHVMRKQQYRRSKLDRYRSELIALHQHGGSLREMAYWLKAEKRIKINVTSIARYLNRSYVKLCIKIT